VKNFSPLYFIKASTLAQDYILKKNSLRIGGLFYFRTLTSLKNSYIANTFDIFDNFSREDLQFLISSANFFSKNFAGILIDA